MSGGREWTTIEVRELRFWYPRIGPTETAAMLDRTVMAVYQKAREIGAAEKDRSRAQELRQARAA